MQNAGQGSEKRSYRVILLLVVGLAAFSSAMKELNQIHELTLRTSDLIAQWSDAFVPAEKPATLVKVETCEIKKILPPPPPVMLVPEVPPIQLESIEIVVPNPLPAPRSNLIQKRDRRSNG